MVCPASAISLAERNSTVEVSYGTNTPGFKVVYLIYFIRWKTTHPVVSHGLH